MCLECAKADGIDRYVACPSARNPSHVTRVIDLDTGQVVWTGMGLGKDALADYWPTLRASVAQIQAASCDMSAVYWNAIMEQPSPSGWQAAA
jgi:transposase